MNTVTQEQINDILSKSEFRVGTVFDKTTVLHVKLPNGFVLTAESACVDPANFDAQLGRALAEKRIVEKLWELEGYALQSRLADEQEPEWDGEPSLASVTPSMKNERIARACHEANREYCLSIGDDSQVPWDEAPDWQKESAIKGVQFHLANPDSTPADSHASWLKEKEEAGWVYGEEKIESLRQHPCMVPYEELPMEQRVKDMIFTAIVKAHA